ncbi:ABC transporter permease [Isobaculum melis]|uniref:ABC-2 family transporter protein n=1 Tax=Isobaculum melis TaxID=142588 RepID=A0A1H9SZT0_9LACT|nr:ABC transporter permease [Isobaculum melis]SER90366.1 ABC-2 family transporter protein [Isobaculum melis]
MKRFSRSIYTEFIKIKTTRAWWIVCGIVLIVQPVIALIGAKQMAQIGLNATPETHPELAVALPPIDYFGFDSTLLGLLPMVILGGIFGASEYKNHQLRTYFLYNNHRLQGFLTKSFTLLIMLTIVSFISIFTTIAITHIGLGHLGLQPIQLSPIAWQFIGLTLLNWVFLTMFAFFLGMLFRTAMVPLIFLVPQIYNLGEYLAEKWSWGTYLPVAAGKQICGISTDTILPHDPIKGGIILGLWTIIAFVAAGYYFKRRDVGGAY